jgi:hypothetical protein
VTGFCSNIKETVLLTLVCLSVNSHSQAAQNCKELLYKETKPLQCWIEELSLSDPGSKMRALRAIQSFGKEAAIALEPVKRVLKDRDYQLAITALETLEMWANGDPTTPSARAIIDSLKESNPHLQAMALRSLTRILATSETLNRGPRAAWYKVFEPLPPGYVTKFDPPLFASQTKYSQSMEYWWTGGRLDSGKITLSRDPQIKERFSERKRSPHCSREIFISETPPQIVVLLARDKAMLVERQGNDIGQINAWKNCDYLDRITEALTARPRTDFRATPETFSYIRPGDQFFEIEQWLGSLRYLHIGDNTYVSTILLSDGTVGILKFQNTTENRIPANMSKAVLTYKNVIPRGSLMLQ